MTARPWVFLFVFGAFTALAGAGYAGPVLETDTARGAQDAVPYLCELTDSAGALDWAAVLRGDLADSFTPVQGPKINFGVIDGSVWLRLEIRNVGHEPIDRFLEIDRTTLDEVAFYRIVGPESSDSQIVRSDTLFHDRSVPARHPVFRVQLDPGESGKYYLRIATAGATSAEVTLLHPEQFWQRESRRIAGMGVFVGFMLIMAAHNLVMYGAFRRVSFLYLAAAIACTCLYVAVYRGFVFQFLLPEVPNLSQRFTLPLVGLAFTFGALFSERFLNARKYAPRIATLLYILAGVGVMVPVANAIDDGLADRVAYTLGVSTPLAIFAAAIRCLRSGTRASKIFMTGWTLLLLATFMSALSDLDVVPDHFVIVNGPILAYPTMLLLLSLASWDRFKTSEEVHRATLEARVEARTNELAVALENVRTLEGLIPICSHCKKIRDDEGSWDQLEHYFSSRSNAEFTHGVCPDCLEEHYANVAQKIRERRQNGSSGTAATAEESAGHGSHTS